MEDPTQKKKIIGREEDTSTKTKGQNLHEILVTLDVKIANETVSTNCLLKQLKCYNG